MPDRPLTIATYAAGASLAAITLVYVFGPTFFLDGESGSSHKKGVVGLSNPANDCFINSILQALAGLGDLRLYLIREVHRRALDGPEVYKVNVDNFDQKDKDKDLPPWKLEGLQQGIVTKALKEVLDSLNERPIYRKTISARGFIAALEQAFRIRVSRQQQDAQEFLQVVTERLCEEYHAGRKARQVSGKPRARDSVADALAPAPELARLELGEGSNGDSLHQDESPVEQDTTKGTKYENDEEGFPFEGKIESQIECLTCRFKPKPAVSTFVTLTLNVPQKSSTSLNSCFDGMLKVEHIDDFKCDKCRLEHALHVKERELQKTSAPEARQKIESELKRIKEAIDVDSENPPKDVKLPPLAQAPKRRIARHMRISVFPKILAIHLSRSIYSASTLSMKNMAKVAFPETLSLGGILDQKKYKLLGVVTHKGGHNSGHYESFRRQTVKEPFSTPHSFGQEGVYSLQGSPNPSAVQSPRVAGTTGKDSPQPSPRLSKDSKVSSISGLTSSSPSLPVPPSPSTSSLSSRSSLSVSKGSPPTSAPREDAPPRPPSSSQPAVETPSAPTRLKPRTKRKQDNRWWRISDDKIKESKTNEVLGMQKEVYLLFYELDRSGAQ